VLSVTKLECWFAEYYHILLDHVPGASVYIGMTWMSRWDRFRLITFIIVLRLVG